MVKYEYATEGTKLYYKHLSKIILHNKRKVKLYVCALIIITRVIKKNDSNQNEE